MKISWVFASTYKIDPIVPIEKIKDIGSTWGSWKTWRSCGTDNVICHDRTKAHELINRAFQAVCNFYIPKKIYQDVNRPIGVKLYDGQFDLEVDDLEDIVAMHLAAASSDIILLCGYRFAKLPIIADDYERLKTRNYHGLARSIISNNQEVQWVAVDHDGEFDLAYESLSNLTCDTMENAIQLLV